VGDARSDSLWRLDAGELARLIAGREVTSAEVVAAHLARIDETNSHLNAVVRVLSEEALEAAERADRLLAAGKPRGPLHGVPCTVKENVDLAGTPTTEGVPALAEVVAPIDAPLVERLRSAGAIPIGRTNMPDFGLRFHTDSCLHGLTRNPWNPERTAGGSSGGEAAALASGMSPLGIGNDIGGSLRNPAHCCGIAAIKPTTGRVPHARALPPEDGILADQLMAVQGVMARRVADLRLGLEVVAGAHTRDPGALPVPLNSSEGSVPRRVALLAEPPGGGTEPRIADVVRGAGRILADRGYEVVDATPPAYEQSLDVWRRWLVSELRVLLPVMRQLMGPDGQRFLDLAEQTVPPLDLAAHTTTLIERRAVARAWSAFLAEHPLVLSPVWTEAAFAHGFDIEGADQAAATLELARPVLPANVLGLPAAAVPAGEIDGLPIGVQVLGGPFRELACLEAAQTIEDAVGVRTPIEPVT
jgi:amidase